MSKDKVLVCRCEEVTRGDILNAIKGGATSIKAIKKVTRAGMGDCQGRTCHKMIASILANELKVSVSEIKEDLPRYPISPVSLECLCKEE